MYTTIIKLPDGTELTSGTGTVNAIQSVTVTQCVNDSTELTLGSACAAMLEAALITPAGGLALTAGDEVEVYRVGEDGVSSRVGIFTLEKPTRPTANTMKLTAYDRITWLDRDLTAWLAGLAGWPYRLYDLANQVCEQCGLTLSNTDIPNGDYLVQRFSAEGITGRQLMKWIGEAAGRFCRATPEGTVEFAWYTPVTSLDIGPTEAGSQVRYSGGQLWLTVPKAVAENDGAGNVMLTSSDITVADDGAGNVTLNVNADLQTLFYYQNGLRFEDYAVAPVEKVQIRQSADDVGTVYPEVTGERNTYIITCNGLLTASSAEELKSIAQALYEQLQTVTYTPCALTIPACPGIGAGNTVSITDINGRTITAYVMTKKSSGQRDSIECTGSARRDSTTAVNNQTYEALSGKVLKLRTDVDGLAVSNEDTKGNVAKLELEIGNISATVAQQEETAAGLTQQVSKLEQTAQGVDLRVQSIERNGVSTVTTETGFTFGKDGLKISKSGESVENLLDHTGMYVKRSGNTVLQANKDGVLAVDVTVKNFLIVGDHARFEDFGSGTGCFWT